MKNTELRIGNLVYYHIVDEKDNPPEYDSLNVIDAIDLQIIESDESYKPIPLTEEWLLKFGFDKIKNPNNTPSWIWLKDKRIFLYEFFENRKLSFDLFIYNDWLKRENIYVHELQNLYFALTGKELEIK